MARPGHRNLQDDGPIVPRSPEIAVIGGGPAGLMAAETIAAAGHRVTVYDRMPTFGRKLLLAGRGGLNLTHGEEAAAFASRYGNARPHLAAALDALGPPDLRNWSAGLGQPTFVGTSGRVFPKGFKATPLLRAWLLRLAGLGVDFAPRHRWTGWSDAGALTLLRQDGTSVEILPQATVLALGGASWPRMGSDGAWTGILHGAGIPATALVPSNSGVEIAWSSAMVAGHAGAPLKRIAIEVEGRKSRGEAVITRAGLEGGAIYALSSAIRAAIARAGNARLRIDLKPDEDITAVAARLGRPRQGQSASTFLRKTLALSPPAIAVLREACGNRLPVEAGELAALVKGAVLVAQGLGSIERAISTAGGVPFSALDDRLMVATRPGLFIAGEMLDWDAPTGGYLLQACFSTGALAGRGAVDFVDAARPAS